MGRQARDPAAICRWLVETHGVAAIPISAFYETQAIRTAVRFCFAKSDATLDEALVRLSRVAARTAAQ